MRRSISTRFVITSVASCRDVILSSRPPSVPPAAVVAVTALPRRTAPPPPAGQTHSHAHASVVRE
ncbi:hypothetical protein EON68_03410 [archaeon]|nr:MAG: hypothetical protein EON68_03410 [archaeon]